MELPDLPFELRRLLFRIRHGGNWGLVGRMRTWRNHGWLGDHWTIIDGGAHVGIYAAAMRVVVPNARLVAVEPFAPSLEKLRISLKEDRNATVVPAAIGREKGSLLLTTFSNEQMNSLLAPANSLQELWPSSQVTGTCEVPVTTVDEIVSRENIVAPVFLKLDVQGAEGDVIEGIAHSWDKIAAIQCEMSLVDMYDGAPRFEAIFGLLSKRGFRLVDVFDFLVPAGEQLPCSCDCLFVRAEAGNGSKNPT